MSTGTHADSKFLKNVCRDRESNEIQFEIDFKRLNAMLEDSCRRDEVYKRENSAKFRAIEQQKCAGSEGTYEQFRQIVAGSHLKAHNVPSVILKEIPFNKHALEQAKT